MRDTLGFLMYDWLEVDSLLACERYADHSRSTFDAVLDASERLARDRFAPFNRLVDTQEPHFDGIRVTLPEATGQAVLAYADSGLLAAGHDYAVGGMQLPYVIDMAANTFFSMASIGLAGYAMLTYANANLIMAHGSAKQKEAFGLPQLTGQFLGTMCLSEPNAGSSLGDILTRAVSDGADFEADPLGPRYRLKGNKMWISGGEHELSKNIIHLVLAKIPDAEGHAQDGVKGISLFIVPRMLIDASGITSNVRNDVALAGLNHKLGYRGIPNTLLNFGEKGGAIGYRIGAPGDGLRVMFHMMNEARINVGMGATMLGYAGYLASLDYARSRKQGRISSAQGKDPHSAQVPIIAHADVKRMLLAQKSYCEGGLALALYCAKLVDEKRGGDAGVMHESGLLLELLTPIAKSWSSEWCLEANNLAIQVHGGYGYTRDFPVEQYWRDNRLNMIHEGTHGIQALDLLGRKVSANGGQALTLWLARVRRTIDLATGAPDLRNQATALAAALGEIEAATRAALADDGSKQGLLNATPYLQAFGHVVIAWLWLDINVTAQLGVEQDAQRHDFYQGKLQAGRYFFHYELPKISAWLKVVARCDSTCNDMADAWF